VISVDVDPEDVLLMIDHPFGRIETTLAEWMRRGPGPRAEVRPTEAYARSTGEPLPLTVIPPAYRNDEESRRLIAQGALASPWG
jgi:hypothetical protein